MTAPGCSENMMRNEKAVRACGQTEIVRGCERRLVDEMAPIVRRQDVSLDMKAVERIDAAGIAALISLYRLAEESGHSFRIQNVAPHVHELLMLVGLERILLSHNADPAANSGFRMTQTAA